MAGASWNFLFLGQPDLGVYNLTYEYKHHQTKPQHVCMYVHLCLCVLPGNLIKKVLTHLKDTNP